MVSVGYQAVQDIMDPLSLYFTRFRVNTLLTLPFPYGGRWIGRGITTLFLYQFMWNPGWPDTRHVKFTELVRFSSTVSLGGLTSGTLPTQKITKVKFQPFQVTYYVLTPVRQEKTEWGQWHRVELIVLLQEFYPKQDRIDRSWDSHF